LQEKIILGESGIELYLDATYNPEWNATCIGTVAATPAHPKGEFKEIPQQLKKGDKVFFSYRVVSDRSHTSEKGFYRMTDEHNEYFRRFTNTKGEWVTVVAYEGHIGKNWVGTHVDGRGELISGVQDTNERTIDRWLSQFQIGDHSSMKYNNLYEIEGNHYWKCNYQDVFAKEVDGKLEAIGNRCLLKPIEYKLTNAEKERAGIIRTLDAKIRLYDRAELLSGGEDLGFKKGDVVGFEQKYLEKYDVFGKQVFLIKKNRINGTWQHETSSK